MGLFSRKSIVQLQAEVGNDKEGKGLRRVIGPFGLIAIGVGIIVGAGLFSVTGLVAANNTGPAITLSFIFAAVACGFAGLCYAELSSMLPVAGSAYTYSYVTMGEFVAWLVGWNLVLEYAIGSIIVSASWCQYLLKFLEGFGITLPQRFCAGPWDGGIVNLPAVFIVIVMSLILMKGTKQSTLLNNIIVSLKIGVILIFIILGWSYINADNFTPYIPENTGTFGEFGWSGILRGAGIVFVAFLGFDAVSTVAQETKNPKRNMPIGIIGSLLVVTIIYVLFGHVMTGVAHYTDFQGQDGIAPVAVAINKMGHIVNGEFILDFPWLARLLVIAILFGYCSVILVMLLSQSRIFMAMAHDGLLPKFFADVNPKTGTPIKNNIFFMIIVSIFTAITPPRIAGELCSIGTLFAFTFVCLGVIIVRRTNPDMPRGFKVPLVPYIPILGIVVCITMMVFLPVDTWIRLVAWMIIGIVVYFCWSRKHSKLRG